MPPPATGIATRSSTASASASDAGTGIAIPACPAVLTDLRAEIAGNNPDAGKVARLVGADVALSVAVLRAVNSPVYGLSRKVESIVQAVSLLGLNRLSSLVMNVLIRQTLSFKGFDLDRFWDISAQRARAMVSLSKIHKRIDADSAQSAGLLCDIGIPLMMQRFPDYGDTMKLANDFNVGISLLLKQFPQYAGLIRPQGDSRQKPVTVIEFERHCIEHAKIGAMMAHTWALSDTLCRTIRHHHDQGALIDPAIPEAVRRLIAILMVAEFTIQRFGGVVSTCEWDSCEESVYAALMWSEQDMVDWTDDFSAAISAEAA